MTLDRAREAWAESGPILTITAAAISLVSTGAVSGLIAAILRPQAPGTDDVVTVAVAFWATWPFSLALVLITMVGMSTWGQSLSPYAKLAGITIVMFIALSVAKGATEPATQGTFGSPRANAETLTKTLIEFAELYGFNMVLGAIAGFGVGAAVFQFAATYSAPRSP